MASKIFGIFLIIIGIGAFLTIVTNVTQILVQKGRDRLRKQRLYMIIGVFFSEIGNQLLRIFVEYDDNINKIRKDFIVKENWGDTDFNLLNSKIRHHDFTISHRLLELEMLNNFLREKGDILLRQLERR